MTPLSPVSGYGAGFGRFPRWRGQTGFSSFGGGWLGELSEDSDLVCVGFFAVVIGDVFGPSGGCDAVGFFDVWSADMPCGVGEEFVVGGVLLECGCFVGGDVDLVPEVVLVVECVVEGAGEVCGIADEE